MLRLAPSDLATVHGGASRDFDPGACAGGTSLTMAEEFRYAGVSFRIPSKYLK